MSDNRKCLTMENVWRWKMSENGKRLTMGHGWRWKIDLLWVPSGSNTAVVPLRVLSWLNCMLWLLAPSSLGVGWPFLLESNGTSFKCFWHDESCLPFFSPFPVAGSAGINVFSTPAGWYFIMFTRLLSWFPLWLAFCVNGAMSVSFSFFPFQKLLKPFDSLVLLLLFWAVFSCFLFFLLPKVFSWTILLLILIYLLFVVVFPHTLLFLSPFPLHPCVCCFCLYVSTSILFDLASPFLGSGSFVHLKVVLELLSRISWLLLFSVSTLVFFMVAS